MILWENIWLIHGMMDFYTLAFKYWDDKFSAQCLKQIYSNINSGDWNIVRQKTYQNYLPLSQETTSMKAFFSVDYLTADAIENRK